MIKPNFDDIRDAYASMRKRGFAPLRAYNACRTEVHEALHMAAPSPYPLEPSKFFFVVGREPEPDEVDAAKRAGITIRTCIDASPAQEAAFLAEQKADLVERKRRRAKSVTAEHVAAAHAYNVDAEPADRVVDGIHYAEKMHHIGLWKETDDLVTKALGAAPSSGLR